MRFSILIPCYNTAAYLEKCINSIIMQTYKDWEMILVNDGSTDNTEYIMYQYAGKDARIRVFSQENQGVSASRNKAVQEARGDYLLFLDSDDWYRDEKCLERIEEVIGNENTDIVVFRYQRVDNNGNVCGREDLQCLNKMKKRVYTGEQYLYAVLSEEKVYPWFSWIYAFRKVIWIENGIQFNPKLWLAEDKDILYQVILKAKKIKILDNPIYQYRVREGSVTQLRSKKLLQAELDACINNINMVKGMDVNEDLKILLNSNFSYGYFGILAVIYYLGKSDRKEIFALLKQNRSLMNYNIGKKYVLIRRLTYIVGLPITAKLLFIRYKWIVEIKDKKV